MNKIYTLSIEKRKRFLSRGEAIFQRSPIVAGPQPTPGSSSGHDDQRRMAFIDKIVDEEFPGYLVQEHPRSSLNHDEFVLFLFYDLLEVPP